MPEWAKDGAGNGKENETYPLAGIQGKGGAGCAGRRQDAGRIGAAI